MSVSHSCLYCSLFTCWYKIVEQLQAQNIVEQINSFTSGSSGRKRQVDDDADNLPSSYQHIVGAVSAPSADTNASKGAYTAVASTIILIIMI